METADVVKLRTLCEKAKQTVRHADGSIDQITFPTHVVCDNSLNVLGYHKANVIWNDGDGYFVYNTAGEIVYVKIAQTSDVRMKKNIENSKISALNYIKKMNFKEFNWIKDNKFEEIGLIAQDLKEINENFISEKEDGFLILNEDSLRMYALKAIQELSTQNNELQQRIIKLEELING